MIEKMTRYNFILLGGEEEKFLADLQELGVVDITRSIKPVDDRSAALLKEAEAYGEAISYLSALEYPLVTPRPVQSDNAAAETFAFRERLNEITKRLADEDKELQLRIPWGEYDRSKLKELEALGYTLRYYNVAKKAFNETWAEEVPLQVISDDGKTVWFVTVSDDPSYSFPVKEITAPEGTADDTRKEIHALEKEQMEIEGYLVSLQEQIPEMEERREAILADLDLYLAGKGSESAVDGHISLFEGFAPVQEEERLTKAFDEMDVLWYKAPAKTEDNPPIKLKNNWFSRMFETLTDMYGMPVYDEFDPTPILAPFFLLFWAFCMGDAGYGLLLIGISFLLKKVDILGLRNHRKLVFTLGVGTFVVGLFLGTFFGINLAEASWFPESLKPLLITGKLPGTSYDLQMVCAIGIGVFHICLAMVIKAVGMTKRFGFKQAISTWGWVLLIIGGLITTALGLTRVLDANVTKWVIIGIGIISALGIYVFNTPGRNPLLNIGAGLWDTYNMATGILGDVLSYIRLYALGLAGGMLGGAFNQLGGMMLGDNPTWQWLPCILILLLGHALNLAMSCLGAFVHPLRLTFVEYFKNSGYEGKGTAFRPLKKQTVPANDNNN